MKITKSELKNMILNEMQVWNKRKQSWDNARLWCWCGDELEYETKPSEIKGNFPITRYKCSKHGYIAAGDARKNKPKGK